MTLLWWGLASHLVLGAGDVTVAVPSFSGTADVPQQKRDFFVEYFSERLASKGGPSTTTPAQISAVLGAERQRQLLGCSADGSSCLAELAGALGTDAIIIGSVAKIGTEFAITLKALDARSSHVLASLSIREKREEALLDALATSAEQIRAELLHKLRGVAAAAPSSSRFGARVWLPGAIGVASGIASGVLFGLAKSTEARLRSGDSTIGAQPAPHSLAVSGNTEQTLSAVFLGVAAAGIATALILYFAFGDAPTGSVQVALTQWGWLPEVAR